MKTKLLLLLLLANFSIYAQINLVPNGGFEIFPGGVPESWTRTNSVNSSTDAIGQYSAKLFYNNALSPAITTLVPLKAGVTYTVKYKYKYLNSNYGGDHPIALNISKAGSNAVLSSSTFASNNSWTVKETTFKPDADLSYDLSISTFSFDSQPFDVLIDEVQVYVQGTEQYTLIPDVNFEKKLIALGFDSGDTDGKVPTININTIPNLNLANSSIADLTGLKDFTALTSLNCKQNQLSTVNFSENPNLLKLDCSGNYMITKLDLSKNTKLTLLDCSYCSLQSLDVTANTALQYLLCERGSNNITTLDLSKNVNLIELHAVEINLSALDVTKNTALKKLACSENKIASLDLSNNTALEALIADSNQLTALDLSNNKLLTDLSCGNNQLTSLDVSKNNALLFLNCGLNKLSSLNLKNGNNSNFLESHHIGFTRIGGPSGSTYTASFKNNSINLNCIQVDDTAYSIAKWSLLKDDNSNFTSLDCAISTVLPDPKFEEKLIALGIDTDGKNGSVLTSSINAVSSLDLSNSSITNSTGIEGFTALTSLNFSGNALKRLNLSKNSALTALNSSGNTDLTCIEVPDLTAASKWTLTKDAAQGLSLDCNVYTLIPDPKFEDYLISLNIDKDGKNGKVLTENIDKLTLLNIYNQGISDLTGIEDFKALTQILAYGNQLTKIDVSKNLALKTLDIQSNQISSIDVSKNLNLASFDCSRNLLTSIDVTSNVNLLTFSISNNKLQELNVSKNTKLTYLLVNGNDLISLDVSKNTQLGQIWCHNNQIVTLDFSNNPKLYQVMTDNNRLVNLNFKNGANTLINTSSGNNGGLRFSQNPDLKCIQVDDVAYSNTNWSTKKDAAAEFSTAACPVVVPYTLIPDANFEDKLIALNIDKDGKNGKVETLNVLAVKSLDLSSSNITDLTGLQDFTRLTSLDASSNNLKTIDVSKNIQLTSLNVSKNQLPTLNVTKNTLLSNLNVSTNTITDLDLSKNTLLSSLKCNSNAIAVLDVSLNTKLTVLSASFNKLQRLDVSKNTLLKEFDCAANDLYNLNLKNGNNANMQGMIFGNFTQNPHLLCIQVDNVTYAADKWIAKDATASYSVEVCPLNEQQTLIPDSNFEQALVALGLDKDGINGKVRTADISKLRQLSVSSSKISDLTGIQDFTSLETLTIDSNNLKTLDLSKNKALFSVRAPYNELTSIDISNSVLLSNLVLYGNKLTTLDVSKNVNLWNLDLSRNQLETIDLTKNVSLSSLDLGTNKIENLNLTLNKQLTTLYLTDNKISTVDLSQNTKLIRLGISSNSLTSLDVSKNTELVEINGNYNQITTLDLSKNPKLTAVYLTNNKLYNLNIANGNNKKLVPETLTFTGNTYLTCIQVDDAAYSDTNWAQRKDVTASYSSQVCANGEPFTLIPDSKFEDKLIALKIDKDGKNGKVATFSIDTLTSLNVSNSEITDLTGIQDFTALTSLEAGSNKLTAINVSKNILLTNLNISKNQLTSLDLSKNSKLSTLNSSYNTIKALNTSNNYSLTNLNCSNNEIASLDFTNNLALSNLNCSNNVLAVLNLSRLTKLTILSASFNKLENLDISKNTLLKEIDCASNNLYNLNLKNGNNVNMERIIFGNFTQNPNLLCIQVDDAAFSTEKWIAKDAAAAYSTEACPVNSAYTLIPDPNFEKALIAKGIDKDGINGKVMTASISGIRQLSLYNNVDKITDLTGIEDFTALESLDCSNNSLTSLNLSKNVKLQGLDCSYNKLTTLDFSANTALTSLSAYNNLLTSINVSKNTALKSFAVSTNKLTTLDISKNEALTGINFSINELTNIDFAKNVNLTSVSISDNKLTTVDFSKNLQISLLNITNNLITTIDVSKNTLLTTLRIADNKLENLNIAPAISLTDLNVSGNRLTALDVSKNKALVNLSASNNKLSSLDVSANPALRSLAVTKNQLETLDVSKNPALVGLYADENQLTSLNLQNGKNTLFETYNLSFSLNPKLYCILVDDIIFANANWSSKKDARASYNIECTGELILPANNFTVETKGESCLGENNGEISIAAKSAFAYTAAINDKVYNFTSNNLKVTALTPGVYKIKVTIPEMIFEQNFTVTIAKAATITGKSSITSKKVAVEITAGTAPYTVFVDGTEQFQTTDSNFNLELEKGGLIEVATAKACEGIFSKKVTALEVGGILSAYPNPTSGSFEIEIPSNKTEVKIELYNFAGQLVSNKIYNIENGKALLNLESQASGIYAAKIYLETPEYLKIIKK